MRNTSPAYRAGYKARLAGLACASPHETRNEKTNWTRGWRAADAVKSGEARCPVCGGGHAITRACDLDGGLEPVKGADPAAILRKLLEDGFDVGAAARVIGDYADEIDPTAGVYRAAVVTSSELECDSNARVSASDEGAFVQTWTWVSNDEAGIKPDDEEEEEEEHAMGCPAEQGEGWPCRCEVNDKRRHGAL